jgi:hypothetical protein
MNLSILDRCKHGVWLYVNSVVSHSHGSGYTRPIVVIQIYEQVFAN